jgi:hypothetical protein
MSREKKDTRSEDERFADGVEWPNGEARLEILLRRSRRHFGIKDTPPRDGKGDVPLG